MSPTATRRGGRPAPVKAPEDPISRLERALARTAYRFRGVLVAPPVLVAAVWPGAAAGTALSWLAGLGLFGVGWSTRIWAQRHLGYRLKRRMKLTTCGPYAYVRNPIYLANSAMSLGAVLASGAVRLLPLALAWDVLVYVLVVRHEERRLAANYGQAYATYCRQVDRWRPRTQAHHRCEHAGGLPSALLAELHTPLIMAPAALHTLAVSAVALPVLDVIRAEAGQLRLALWS